MLKGFSIRCLWVGCLATLCLPVIAAEATAQTAGVCDLEGSSAGPCKVEIDLADRVLPRPLPFDVPVFLEGTLSDKEPQSLIQRLVLHIFQARQPIRVVEECPGTPTVADCLPADRVIACYRQGSEGSIREAEAVRPISELDGGEAEPERCSLVAQASTWERPADDDRTFYLRVPALEANRYFVLYLEAEQRLKDDEIQRLQVLLQEEVETRIDAALRGQGGNFNDWAQELKDRICSAFRQVAGRHRVRFHVPPDSLFDCRSEAVEPDVLNKQLLRYIFNPLADSREQLRVILESQDELKTDLCARVDDPSEVQFLGDSGCTDADPDPTSPDEAGLLGITLNQVNDPDVRLVPQEVWTNAAKLHQQLSALNIAEEEKPESLELVLASLDHLEESREEFWRLATETVTKARAMARTGVFVDGSTIGAFLTRQRAYLSADFGFLYAEGPEEALPYIGTNIYFRPVNKQAPLTWRDGHPWKRLGVTIGATVGDFKDDRAEPLFSSNNLLIGVGYRVTESIRLGGGVVGFKKKDPDPLVSRTSPATSYYVSASFDWDVNSLIHWFGNFFGRTP